MVMYVFQLSYDYKFDIEDDAHKIMCMCGAPNCRKWMNWTNYTRTNQYTYYVRGLLWGEGYELSFTNQSIFAVDKILKVDEYNYDCKEIKEN